MAELQCLQCFLYHPVGSLKEALICFKFVIPANTAATPRKSPGCVLFINSLTQF